MTNKPWMMGLCLAMMVGMAPANTLNLWLSRDSQNPGTPSDPGALLSGEALTLWASGEVGDKWIGITFDLMGTGIATIDNDELIAPGTGLYRWEKDSQLTGSEIGMVAVTTQGLQIGSALDNIKVGDAYRLGTIVATSAEIDLRGAVGFARSGAMAGEDTIVTAGAYAIASDDTTSVIPLAGVPEPASLLLLALVSLTLRRR